MIFALDRAKVQMSTPFLIDVAHVFYVPIPSLLRVFFVFFAGNVGSLKTQMSPQKYQNPNIWRKKKTKKHAYKVRQGHIEHVCKISGSYLSKAAWTLDSEGILEFYASSSL